MKIFLELTSWQKLRTPARKGKNYSPSAAPDGLGLFGFLIYKDFAPTELYDLPLTGPDVDEKSRIAQDLKLLPDFIADVAVGIAVPVIARLSIDSAEC